LLAGGGPSLPVFDAAEVFRRPRRLTQANSNSEQNTITKHVTRKMSMLLRYEILGSEFKVTRLFKVKWQKVVDGWEKKRKILGTNIKVTRLFKVTLKGRRTTPGKNRLDSVGRKKLRTVLTLKPFKLKRWLFKVEAQILGSEALDVDKIVVIVSTVVMPRDTRAGDASRWAEPARSRSRIT